MPFGCANAAKGHDVAPPTKVMNSRRRMSDLHTRADERTDMPGYSLAKSKSGRGKARSRK